MTLPGLDALPWVCARLIVSRGDQGGAAQRGSQSVSRLAGSSRFEVERAVVLSLLLMRFLAWVPVSGVPACVEDIHTHTHTQNQ